MKGGQRTLLNNILIKATNCFEHCPIDDDQDHCA